MKDSSGGLTLILTTGYLWTQEALLDISHRCFIPSLQFSRFCSYRLQIIVSSFFFYWCFLKIQICYIYICLLFLPDMFCGDLLSLNYLLLLGLLMSSLLLSCYHICIILARMNVFSDRCCMLSQTSLKIQLLMMIIVGLSGTPTLYNDVVSKSEISCKIFLLKTIKSGLKCQQNVKK